MQPRKFLDDVTMSEEAENQSSDRQSVDDPAAKAFEALQAALHRKNACRRVAELPRARDDDNPESLMGLSKQILHNVSVKRK